jgi:hypothetical protein
LDEYLTGEFLAQKARSFTQSPQRRQEFFAGLAPLREIGSGLSRLGSFIPKSVARDPHQNQPIFYN